jgi:hypothetical protein
MLTTRDFFPLKRLEAAIFELIRVFQPEAVVELGTGEGNSTLLIARALKCNKKGHLFSYDSYSERIHGFSKTSGNDIRRRLRIIGATAFVSLNHMDIMEHSWDRDGIDLLVVDADNNYHRLETIYRNWFGKVTENGFVIFEGGCSEHKGESRGISAFCEFLNVNKWQTFTFMVNPGAVIARRITADQAQF